MAALSRGKSCDVCVQAQPVHNTGDTPWLPENAFPSLGSTITLHKKEKYEEIMLSLTVAWGHDAGAALPPLAVHSLALCFHPS